MKISLLLVVVCGALANPIEYYTTADDNFDMEAVVKDSEKLKAMTDCFLDRGSCDPIANSFKLIIPDSLAGLCNRCNDAQKHLAHTYIRGLLTKTPDEHENFLKKYDPDGKNIAKFLEAVKDY